MTNRPILFSAEMVRAILAGRKTQTRRVIKPQPWVDNMGNACWKNSNFGQNAQGVPHIQSLASPVPSIRTKRVLCPYGAPGDLLWVRETWGAVSPTDEPVPLALGQCEIEYRADLPPGCTDGPGEWPADERNLPGVPKWRPSIHMPRWASRITLRITDVRVERLQDILEDDAIAEGVDTERYVPVSDSAGMHASGEAEPTDPIEEYRNLWTSINGPGAWEANPWVWVVEFERVKP